MYWPRTAVPFTVRGSPLVLPPGLLDSIQNEMISKFESYLGEELKAMGTHSHLSVSSISRGKSEASLEIGDSDVMQYV